MVPDGIVDRAGAIVGSGVGAASPRTVCSEGVALFVDGAATTGSAGSDGEAGRVPAQFSQPGSRGLQMWRSAAGVMVVAGAGVVSMYRESVVRRSPG